ncbi:MAG TPA: hypothetical protein VIV54_15105 [Burkholderiales bacterium]
MRSWLLLLSLAVGLAAATAQAQPQRSIHVQAGDWGAASVQDIEAVLNSVADVLLPDFPQQARVRIVVSPVGSGPRVLAAKSADGAHQVLLSVRDARWDQFAYQFSHELCHIASNYDHREIDAARPHQWFEETVCEAVSLVALDRLATRWQESPPHRGWESYAPAFRRYAERLTADRAASTSLASWHRENEAALERDPYLREKNQLAAIALVRVFQRSPQAMQAVGYLNLASSSGRFEDYLAAWADCCPASHRAAVARLISLFQSA